MTPTPTLTPSDTPTPENPSGIDTPTPGAETPTEVEEQVNTPAADTPTPGITPFPTPAETATPAIPPPEFVRSFFLHPSFSLFTQPVSVPQADGFSSSDLGYAVTALTGSNERQFISFDRYGRIFQRDLPLSQEEFSGTSLVDGSDTFGHFFEAPPETRRFRFERFNLDETVGAMTSVEHLGADAIAFSFAGSETGTVMAVLKYPNVILVHRFDADGNYLGANEFTTPSSLPSNPTVMKAAVSGDRIGVLYSSNYIASFGTSSPLQLWITDMDGTVLTETAVTIPVDLYRDSFTGGGQGRFFFVGTNGQLYRLSEIGIEMETALSQPSLGGMVWHDDLLYLLDETNHEIWGYNEDGIPRNGPISIFPPDWDRTPQWLRLKKSGPDLGAFFTDPSTNDSVYYMQIEAGIMATPTPLPAAGISTGATMTVPLFSGAEIELVLIPKGTYLRGSPDSEEGRRPNEGPQHYVTIRNDFLISRHEVTNKLFRLFDPTHQDRTSHGINVGESEFPVVWTTWDEANAFCDWLSSMTEYTFSLPTEAEWEYVCRSGTESRRPWDWLFTEGGEGTIDDLVCNYANTADLQASSGWRATDSVGCDDGFPGPAPVGSFPANAFGVYDMMGNAREWCSDWFGLYESDSLTDPSGPSFGYSRVIRGGSWQDGPDVIRSAFRSGRAPSEATDDVGFRVVVRGTN